MAASMTYDETLNALSEASVRKNFDAFVDIPWDDPGYHLDPHDARWKLPAIDPLGSHPWYRSLPEARQIEIGLLRQANIAKTGVHFENALMRGLLQHCLRLPNGSPEFRYCTHEVTEETHHTQMFQEFVNRSGMDVAGAPWWFRAFASISPIVAATLPEIFFAVVLLGEEPLDHVQKSILRAEEESHPLIQRIMQIHVAEEARHISFAHEFIAERTKELNPLRKALLALAFPVLARALAEVIAVPSPEFARQAGIPSWVLKELYTREMTSETRSEMYGDVRMFVDRIGMLNRLTKPLWNILGVGGRPSRHRGETAQYAAAA